MAEVTRLRATWTGWPGAPGYTNIFAQGNLIGTPQLDGALTAFHDFFADAVGGTGGPLPRDVTITVDSEVAVFDETTGLLVDLGQGLTTDPVVNNNGLQMASPAGACITWRTATVVNGRLLRGRLFLVPLSTTAYEFNGTLTTSVMNDVLVAAQTLVVAIDTLCVWHRPVSRAGGATGQVTSATMTDQAAVLRSRR